MRTKSLLLISAFTCAICAAMAQAPQLMNYQAVVRNAQGQPVTDTKVNFKFQIHDTAAGGPVVFTETDTVTTNKFGLAILAIGTSDTLGNVNWSSAGKFLEVSVDVTGGSNFTGTGTSQLLSVPYAMYSGSSANGLPASSVTGAIPFWDGSEWAVNSTNFYDDGGNIGIGTAGPASLFSNTVNNTLGADGYGDASDAFSWFSSGFGYAATIYNAGGGGSSDGLLVKLNDPTSVILDLGVGGEGGGTTPVMVVRGSGNIGIGTASPAATLDVNGTTHTNQFEISNGNVFSNMQGGQYDVGTSNTAEATVTVNYPVTFTSTPMVIATAQGCCGNIDVYAVTVINSQPGYFTANILRVDANSGWGQDLQLIWWAWQ